MLGAAGALRGCCPWTRHWSGRADNTGQSTVTKQIHCHSARSSVGVLKLTEIRVRAQVLGHHSWGCALQSGTALGTAGTEKHTLFF